MKFETKIKAAAAAIILVMSTVAILPMIVNRQVTMVMDELDSAANVERLQLTLLEMLLNAETAQRGFVITGSERFLEPYYYAVNTIPSTQAALRKEMTSSVEIARAEAIEQASAAKLRTVTETINLRREQGFTAAAAFITGGTGKAQMDVLRKLIGNELSVSAQRRSEITARLRATSNSAANASLVATLTNILFLGAMLIAGQRVLRQRNAAEHKAQAAAEQAGRDRRHAGQAVLVEGGIGQRDERITRLYAVDAAALAGLVAARLQFDQRAVFELGIARQVHAGAQAGHEDTVTPLHLQDRQQFALAVFRPVVTRSRHQAQPDIHVAAAVGHRIRGRRLGSCAARQDCQGQGGKGVHVGFR